MHNKCGQPTLILIGQGQNQLLSLLLLQNVWYIDYLIISLSVSYDTLKYEKSKIAHAPTPSAICK